jgi:site-specific recombinase XerD
MILGHASLEMGKTYAKLAAMDLKNVHQRASPADRWRL